jgi:60 kDa SS-A/Ro ribonucleoprotein
VANKKLFKSSGGVSAVNNAELPAANTVNGAGGAAYSMSAEAALAQLALTGTFHGTYYASAESTLQALLKEAELARPEFLAKLAVYSRNNGFMKDSPALLLAILMKKDLDLFKKAFPFVIDNGKMLKNFVQIVRSGVVGRKSFGSGPKRLIRAWLEGRNTRQLLEDSVGQSPSLHDVIKMVHPKPANKEREALYRYLIGKPMEDTSLLPELVRSFEEFKNTPAGVRKVPNVPFQLLTAQNLSEFEWAEIAKNGKWHQTRMNLNTYARHGVFKNQEIVQRLAQKLSEPEEVRRAKVFPYQLFVARRSVDAAIPELLVSALENAMEVATENIPKFNQKVVVGVDYSGSMRSPVTGNRGTATTIVTCNQVASLIAACIMRNSTASTVYRFDTRASKLQLNPADSIIHLTNLIGANGGGTDCSSVLKTLNATKENADVVFIISDNESWSNTVAWPNNANATMLMNEWNVFKRNNPKAKLVLIDLAANTTTQAPNSPDVLNVGGFSDSVFEVIDSFLKYGTQSDEFWVNRIMNEVML